MKTTCQNGRVAETRLAPKRCVLHLEADTLEALIADTRKALLNLEEALKVSRKLEGARR